ncbi:hypothetical protein FGG08_003422 [Glutinoglossum americanum]|uniref:Polyamine transport protein n=1 Tax=Glutinoglossum americanum TaxID=1670608 RepID=A0A9P8I2N0_9PEZI|nr:hypothetical protein FGG08_003422 [Glutinoglossum americanum]
MEVVSRGESPRPALRPLTPSQYSLAFGLEKDNISRRRSLFVADDDHDAPKSLYQTPQYNFQTHSLDDLPDKTGNSDPACRVSAVLMQNLGQSMVSTGFGGPERQIGDMDIIRSSSALGRRVSQKSRSDGNLIGKSRLDQRAIGNTVGRDISTFEISAASKALLETLSQRQEESKVQPKRHYLPRLVLRPINPPEKGDLAKDGSRPSMQSAPSSYMLDLGARPGADTVTISCPSCRAAAGLVGPDREALSKTLPTMAISDARPDAMPLPPSARSLRRSQTAGSDTGIHVMGSISAVRSRSSSISTKSRGINYHALLKRSPSASEIGMPLPPVLSQSLAHCDYPFGSNRLAPEPKTATIEDNALGLLLRDPSPQPPTPTSFDSHNTFTDALKKIPTGGAERRSSVDGGLTENKTFSDYSSSRQAAEEESVDLNGVSNHTALSYEKLIVRPTLQEGSAAILTAPLEIDSQEPKCVRVGPEDYISSLESFSKAPIMVNSLAQSPISLYPSPGSLSQEQQLSTDLKTLDISWSAPIRDQAQNSKAGTGRIPIPPSLSEQPYIDLDISNAVTNTAKRHRSSRVPPRLSNSKAFRVAGTRRYSSPDAAQAIAAARLVDSSRPYSQGVSRVSVQPGYGGSPRTEAGATQWIRQLLRRRIVGPKSDSPPYLTSRPSQRLQTVPSSMTSNGVADLSPPIYDSPSFCCDKVTAETSINCKDGKTSETGTQFQREASDSFNKMIQGLEVLLNEALHIAKEVSERQVTQQPPQILQDAVAQLDHEAISSVPSSQSSSSSGSQKSIVLSPLLVGSRRTSDLSIPTESRVQKAFAQSRSRSLSNRLASDPPRPIGSAIPATVDQWDIEPEVVEQLDSPDHIRIFEPLPPEHPPSTRKPTADHLPTPYPNGSKVTSQTSLANTIVKPDIPSESRTPPELVGTLPQDGGRLAASSPIETPQQESEQYFQRSETNTSNYRTPPRFYGGDEESYARQRARRNTDPAYAADRVFRDRHGEPQKPHSIRTPVRERVDLVVRDNRPPPNLPSRDDVHRHIRRYNTPPIQPRHSSSGLRQFIGSGAATHGAMDSASRQRRKPPKHVLGAHRHYSSYPPRSSETPSGDAQHEEAGESREHDAIRRYPSIRNHHHISLHGAHRFSLRRSHRRQPISRDWSTVKKRFTAAVACISTALVGVIVGVYAGEVPAIQYQITDLHHYAILGNVFLYIGLAIPTLVFWPLPLLHGRKPYTLVALALLLPLQLPQGMIVSTPRSPDVAGYRTALLTVRGLSGLALGFANINFKTTLLDLFGSSLQSGNPHQERVIENDVRRHGGGMGVWLGIWSFCFIGSIGVGFLIGAWIINEHNPQWGFWLVMFLTAWVLLLNVLSPEVRRSAYRRSVAEILKGTEVSRRLARGEIKMHIYSTGPKWWWEEVHAGLVLCARMMKQPGFAVVALYSSWIYGQIVMVVVLLGALTSRYYRFRSPYVGLCVSAVPIGALLAAPLQKGSLFSRARHHPQRTDSMTFEKRVTWSTHLVRRAFFMLALPFADLAYTLASGGTRTHFMVPTMLAGLIGFLSILAISECNGIIMETFDTSDLQRASAVGTKRLSGDAEKAVMRRTNYSCYPRVSSAFAIMHSLGFVAAALATATGGKVERKMGAQAATGVVAGILLVLTVALSAVLWRWKEVQMVPDLRHRSRGNFDPAEDEEEEWEPVIIGNPSGKMRRMSILELGSLSRWSEIRRLNKILEQSGVGMSRWSQVRRSLHRKERGADGDASGNRNGNRGV